MDCPICLMKFQTQDMISLHDQHLVCQECNTSLRSHFILSCPICRTPINEDLRSEMINSRPHSRIISYAQLLSFNISQEFIDYLYLEQRIPFYYTGRFEGVDFIHQIKNEHEEWLIQANDVSSSS